MSNDPPSELLYHALQAPLYPTNDPGLNLLAIRFASPVRLSSVRITPEGVASPNGPGLTHPAAWSGKIFLNVSPSTPVNAMVELDINVEDSKHPLDYRIDMPSGVTTRLLSFLTPADTLSISVYGYGPNPSAPGPSTNTAPAVLVEQEDWIWVSDWAGGVSGLLDLVENASTYSEVRHRAISSLELLQSTITGGILPILLDAPSALAQLFAHSPDSSLCVLLLNSKDHILHLNLKPHVPQDHPLYELIHAPAEQKRAQAWRAIEEGRPALTILTRTTRGRGDFRSVSQGYEESNLSRLIALAEEWSQDTSDESKKCLELALDVIQSPPRHDQLIARTLASRLPPLVLALRMRGSSRSIRLPESLGRDIIKSILPHSTRIINGKSAFATSLALVQPYLAGLDPADPLHHILSQKAATPALSPFPDTSDGRALKRLEAALSASQQAPTSPSSLVCAVTSADLLSIIAPNYLQTLSSAPIPLLDIPSSIADFTPDSQASAWAGKVYSQHQFRTRENVGLGIAGVAGQASRVSRPASRHVDEYVR